jgi:hypothetical protein
VPGTDTRYPCILATERLVATFHNLKKLYGPLTLSSGFRDPVRQLEVHGSVGESHHQYGRAADLYVAPDSAPPKTGRNFASELDWLRLAAASLRAGGVWIEPMTDTHVNTDHCHVHVDVREQGAQSAIVRVAGRVTDAGGNPVPGATVRLAGMPAVTNADGRYVLKHVVTPRDYDLLVEAPGLEPVTQKVSVVPATTLASVQLPAGEKPTLTARAAGTETDAAGKVNVRLAVRNIGRSPAMGVTLAAASGAASVVGPPAPADIRSLGPGKEQVVLIQLASRGGLPAAGAPAVFKLTASFRTPAGEARVQDMALSVPMPQPPTPAGQKTAAEASEMPRVAAPPREETLPEPKHGPDLAPAAGGLAIGGAAAAAGALARRKTKPAPKPAAESAPKPAEPSVDPSALPGDKGTDEKGK